MASSSCTARREASASLAAALLFQHIFRGLKRRTALAAQLGFEAGDLFLASLEVFFQPCPFLGEVDDVPGGMPPPPHPERIGRSSLGRLPAASAKRKAAPAFFDHAADCALCRNLAAASCNRPAACGNLRTLLSEHSFRTDRADALDQVDHCSHFRPVADGRQRGEIRATSRRSAASQCPYGVRFVPKLLGDEGHGGAAAWRSWSRTQAAGTGFGFQRSALARIRMKAWRIPVYQSQKRRRQK